MNEAFVGKINILNIYCLSRSIIKTLGIRNATCTQFGQYKYSNCIQVAFIPVVLIAIREFSIDLFFILYVNTNVIWIVESLNINIENWFQQSESKLRNIYIRVIERTLCYQKPVLRWGWHARTISYVRTYRVFHSNMHYFKWIRKFILI